MVAYWVGQLTAYYISLLLEEEWVLMALLVTLLRVLLPIFFLHLLITILLLRRSLNKNQICWPDAYLPTIS